MNGKNKTPAGGAGASKSLRKGSNDKRKYSATKPPPARIDVEAIKSQIDPVAFYRDELEQMPPPRGASPWVMAGICWNPAHHDSKPGSAYFHRETGAYVCHSCGARCSDVVDFVQQKYGLDFLGAIAWLSPDSIPRTSEAGKPRLSLRSALDTLQFELSLTAICASAMARGEQLSAEDRERLIVAVRRCNAIKEACE